MNLEFVDTIVLLYAYDVTAGERHERARELVGQLGRTRSGALSVQVLQEFYVNAVRKIAVPLSPVVARERVRTLGRWTAHAPVAHDVLVAIDIAEQERLSFWDAMIIRSASALGCVTLWTEDLNAGQLISGVRIENPFAGS
ncbi:MAG TPA: PIN domain-containing protein [Trueperaceae bacterium]|nr:PIN domain-containing protein [Trueperaceae bacterium]